MEKTKLLSTLAILFLVMPIISAIYVGEATSEPTIITLTIGEPEDNDDSDNDANNIQNNRFSQLEAQRIADESIEANLRQVTYSDWICINHKLQRTITTLNHVEYEYGQLCNIPETNEEVNVNNLFIALNILLIIFIALSIILIIAIVLTRN
jgi:hypothetical protein